MLMTVPKQFLKLALITFLCLSLQACLGKIVGSTVDVAIEVVKIPFKVGGAVIDVVSGDGSSKKKNNDNNDSDEQTSSNKDG